MRLVDDEEDDLDMLFNKLSKKSILDVKQLELDKGSVDTYMASARSTEYIDWSVVKITS